MTRGAPRHRGRIRAWAAVFVTLLATALLAGACGGGAPGVATVSTSTTASGASGSQAGGSPLVVAGRCLRANGLTGFPDPVVATTGPAKGHRILDKQALVGFPQATVDRATAACATDLARAGLSGGSEAANAQQIADGLAFARCVRRHGVSSFPDPDSQGHFDLAGTGINEHALTAKQLAAVRACVGASHGEVHIPAQDGSPNS